MARWEPDSRGRLRQAAMDLYADRGFENTTVAEIATRAGVTERTFFRHFADKREVLFSGSEAMQDALARAVADAAPSESPMDAAIAGIEAAGAMLPERRESSRQRQAIITANADLRERELIKLASMTEALAEALRRRGVEDPAAALTAEVAMAVFRVSFERWLGEKERRDFSQIMRDSRAELTVLTG
jgi:AcrR family transcriptional regulator